MNEDKVKAFLKSQRGEQKTEQAESGPNGKPSKTLSELVVWPSTNIILGNVGSGKSGLGYYLLENLSKHHSLRPVVVNLPRDKQHLLPEGWEVTDLEGLKHTDKCVALIDEGTTAIPAGVAKLEEMIKGFNSLSRQRHQIIIFIFHSSKDVGSRILRGIYGAIMIKEPSQRQIQYGSKDKWMKDMLTEARANFKSLESIGEDKRAWTYVDTEKPEYRGMVKNSLPPFWCTELSEAWADTDNTSIVGSTQSNLSVPGEIKGWKSDDPAKELTVVVTPEMEKRAIKRGGIDDKGNLVPEPNYYQDFGYVVMEDPFAQVRWLKKVY